MFSSTIEVLEVIVDNGSKSKQKYKASHLLEFMQSFDFIFRLHLMRNTLGVTNELSIALQQKDQDIINAMSLVKICKQQLQMMRDSVCDSLIDQIFSLCEKKRY